MTYTVLKRIVRSSDGQKVTWHKELADTAVFIASFAMSRNGDIYVVDNTSGFIHALERTPEDSAASRFPSAAH